jgi:hypothetical protein
VSENRMLVRIYRPKRQKVTGGGENCKIRNFILCTLQGNKIKEEMCRACNMDVGNDNAHKVQSETLGGQRGINLNPRLIL